MEANFDEIEAYLCKFGEGTITLSKELYEKGIAMLKFENPRKRNAISGKMMVLFRRCVLELEQWEAGKAVLLHGVGGNFCSGGDLDFARATGTQEEALVISEWMQDTLRRLNALPLISVCLLEGPTLGGGAEIAVFCDFLLAARDARFSFVHARMGIITAWGGTSRLVQKIGQNKALELLLTAKVLDAGGCVDIGVADCVLQGEKEGTSEAVEWIEARIGFNSHVVRSFKAVARNAALEPFASALDFERGLFSTTWGSAANREALARNIKHLKLNKKSDN